jgi:hypothetical protein
VVIETGDRQMTYQILNTQTGKLVKEAITRRAFQFETTSDAEHFAASMLANNVAAAQWRPNQASRRFGYRVVEG